ncbi:DUF2829 domain-containing protein [Terrisporobacter glycolicus]|nr:DUF2829 domain-containing protein [Terrisporobacter glycolicus]
MLWNEAFKLMKEGHKVKLPSWGGYWYWDKYKETIIMHCKDNNELDIREMQVVEYTFSNIASDEWILAEKENTPILVGVATFNFGEALKYLKRGLKVCRKGWNGKGMYIDMDKGGDYKFSEIYPFFVIKNVLNSLNTWVPSVSDLMAEDWMFYEEK